MKTLAKVAIALGIAIPIATIIVFFFTPLGNGPVQLKSLLIFCFVSMGVGLIKFGTSTLKFEKKLEASSQNRINNPTNPIA